MILLSQIRKGYSQKISKGGMVMTYEVFDIEMGTRELEHKVQWATKASPPVEVESGNSSLPILAHGRIGRCFSGQGIRLMR